MLIDYLFFPHYLLVTNMTLHAAHEYLNFQFELKLSVGVHIFYIDKLFLILGNFLQIAPTMPFRILTKVSKLL